MNQHGTDLGGLTHVQVITRVLPGGKVWVAQHSTDYHEAFAKVRTRLDDLPGDWRYWIVRPTHTAANIR